MFGALFRIVFAICVMAVIFVAWSLSSNVQALQRDPAVAPSRSK
jgi:hypothetical protein